MKIPPKFSVIIPVKNNGHTICRAINSVLNQDYPVDEIIIVDGHSTDDGPEKIRQYTENQIRFTIQPGTGVSEARNIGVDLARNEYVAFLDADDEWTPSHLHTIVRLIHTYPGAGIYTDSYLLQKPNEIETPEFKTLPPPPWEGPISTVDFFKQSIVCRVPVHTSAVVIPKRVFIECGGFPKEWSFNEDHVLWFKIALVYPIVFSHNIGEIYYWDGDTLYSHYPYLTEMPVVQTLKDTLKNSNPSPQLAALIKAYIGKAQVYAFLRNTSLWWHTIKKANPLYIILFILRRQGVIQ